MSQQVTSVIVPVSNQSDHIEQVVRAFDEVLDQVPGVHEIILVENRSTDDTLEICQRLSSQMSSVRYLTLDRSGWGRAVKAGIASASGDLICYTNSARTSPPDLALAIMYARVYPDLVVKANRKIRDNWRRRLGSLIYNLECRALFDLSYWDINGTPKVFPRSFAPLMNLTRDDDLIDAEFNAICRRQNYRVIEIPMFSTRRHGGRSTTNYRSAVNMYKGAFDLWRSMKDMASDDAGAIRE